MRSFLGHCIRQKNIFLMVLLLLSFGGCASLPDNAHQISSTVINDGASTTLGRMVGLEKAQHPGASCFFLLDNGLDAFAARAAPAGLAERSIDHQVTVVGGRNIGNEYFEADPNLAFGDLDVLAIGLVVSEVSSSFDAYWNNELSYPITTLKQKINPKKLWRRCGRSGSSSSMRSWMACM